MDDMIAKGYAKKATSPNPMKTTYLIMMSSTLTNLITSEWYLTIQQKFVGNQ